MEPEATASRRALPRYVVTASEQPVAGQSDPNAEAWIGAGSAPCDRGRMVQLISQELTEVAMS